jgi:hypothetical protein
MNDLKMVRWLLVLLVLPLGLSMCSEERFRYPCQDPSNWDKAICQKPQCDVTRTCPEHVFKGGRDPRLGMPDDKQATPSSSTPTPPSSTVQGANCGK